MKNKRLVQFATAGFVAALVLQAAGYLMDRASRPIALGDQALFNWLTFLFSPVALFFRLRNPDGPIVASWSLAAISIFANAAYYALSCKLCQIMFARLAYKLRNEESLRVYTAPAIVRRVVSTLDMSNY
jgi:hypothetical protein